MVSAPDVLPMGSQQPRLCSQGMLTMNAHACRRQIMAQAQACDLAILPALDNILESAQAGDSAFVAWRVPGLPDLLLHREQGQLLQQRSRS
jgi:hypothetical protein